MTDPPSAPSPHSPDRRDEAARTRLAGDAGSAIAVELATAADVDELLALRDATARWPLTRGINQWHPGEVPRSLIGERVEAGAVWVVRGRGGRNGAPQSITATVTVIWTDVFVWGDADGLDGQAGYIHGLGHHLAAWAEDQISRAGHALVRLDCVASNTRLRAIYKEWGYGLVRERGFSPGPDGRVWHPAALYEKVLA